MNHIYFVKKGCTEKANVDLIWPTKHLSYTPKAFFEAVGIHDVFVVVNPVQIDKKYYKFDIELYSVQSLKWQNYGDRQGNLIEYMMGTPLSRAYYEQKNLLITTYSQLGKLRNTQVHEQSYWSDLHEMLELIRAAVVKCDQYFPKQTR